jgi:thymidylate kinase
LNRKSHDLPVAEVPESVSVTIVSFSGIDGAGKSTQVFALESWLRQAGVRARLVTFWDDVVVFSRFREHVSHKVFKGDQGVGSPEKPLHRRDKNVRHWPVTAMRFLLYSADLISLFWKVREIRKATVDVVIFDRYIYDELANLPLHGSFTRIFVQFLLMLTPRPNLAYVVDADPVAALARKPEYPLAFVQQNRASYAVLANLAGNVRVIAPDSLESIQARIREDVAYEMAAPELNITGSPILE